MLEYYESLFVRIYRLLFFTSQSMLDVGSEEEKAKLRWQFVVTLRDFYALHMSMWVAAIKM
jgi:hypothetical protein